MAEVIEIFSRQQEKQRLLVAVDRVSPQALQKVEEDTNDKSRVEQMIGGVQGEISRGGRAGALHYMTNLRMAA